MIKNHFILILFLLSGCATSLVENNNSIAQKYRKSRISDGIWAGKIQVAGTYSDDTSIGDDGEIFKKTLDFMVTVCDGEGIFFKMGDRGYAIPSVNYKNDSYFGSHLIYFQNAEKSNEVNPDWVEMQSMLLVEVDSNLLRVQWSRSVNNPKIDKTEKDSNVFVNGVGSLKRTANNCSDEIIQIYKDRMKTLQ
jgi:hypothetical protein